jgi:group I intron endonuclease
MKISGIYKIQSLSKPERCYIGSAINIHQRWIQHLSHLKNNTHHTSKLQRHYNKYGKNDLVFSIVIGCDKPDLLTTEQFFLDSLNPWFNTCKIAGNTLGIKASKKTKQKLSRIKKGKPTWNKGLKLSETHKRNIGKKQLGENNSFYNKKHTEETKKKISEWNLLQPAAKEAHEKQRLSLIKHYTEKKLLETINQN